MNTVAKTILGIALATTAGAVLGISIDSEQRSFLLSKIKAGAKVLIHGFSSIIANENVGEIESNYEASYPEGEMTSELIDIDQYETYSSKQDL